MSFAKDATLNQVVANMKNGNLLSKLSPQVVAVETSAKDPSNYDSLMIVKSWGMKSRLLSHCREAQSSESWTRSCQLDVTNENGGDYMVWKKDELSCGKDKDKGLVCHAAIEGQGKAVRILGFEILNEETFMVRAKLSALENYGKLWLFAQLGSRSVPTTQEDFKKSKLRQSFENYLSQGLIQAKTNSEFHFTDTIEVEPAPL